MWIEGEVERSPEVVIHLTAMCISDRRAELSTLSKTQDANPQLYPADEFLRAQYARGAFLGMFVSSRSTPTFIKYKRQCARCSRGINEEIGLFARDKHPT
jgi:hypothetical protein